MSWTTNSGHFPHGIELDFLHCHVSTFFVILSEINSNTIAGEFWSCLPTLLDFPLIPRVGFGGTRNPNFLLLITKDPPVRSRLKPWRMTRMIGGREYPLGIGKQDQPLTRSIPYDQRIHTAKCRGNLQNAHRYEKKRGLETRRFDLILIFSNFLFFIFHFSSKIPLNKVRSLRSH